MPKSAILIVPSSATIRFSGFRSRWTIDRASACVRPASIPSSTPSDWAVDSGAAYARSDPRATYSIAMYGTASCSK